MGTYPLEVDNLSLFIAFGQKKVWASNTILTYASALSQQYKEMTGVNLAGECIIKKCIKLLGRG